MMATFEDRLLEELQREIAARGPQPAPAPRRRVVTVPRLALAAGLATAATVTAVVLPGPLGAPKAYAVDQNGDGSVTVKLFDLTLEREVQDALVARLRALGVLVSVDSPPAGTACAWPRGEVLQHPAGILDSEAFEELVRKWSGRGVAIPMPPGTEGKGPDADWRATLHRGDTLVIERNQLGAWYSAVKGAAAPCDPQPFAPKPVPSDGTRG
ncbi:hypothetical protein [Streptomyces sp. NPDC057375]|uniref:hypothetical protein n=1 Tax=Streptomyces sp. NPDC057375 TaxID=3346109 RepID=UPI0036257929